MARPVVGVLAPLVAGPFFGTLLAGVTREVAVAGGHVVAVQTLDVSVGDEHAQAPEFVVPVAWDHLDAVVVIINAVRPSYLEALRAAGKPVVLICHEWADFPAPSVMADNRSGIAQAVEHLLGHGHRRIAFAGHLGQADIRERYDAYCATLRAHGIEPDPALFVETGSNMRGGGRLAGQAMLAAGVPSTAVVASTDFIAIGLSETLREAGLDLPRDQAIVGFDDTEVGAASTPALSSVNQPFERIGARAARLVLDALDGAPLPPQRHLLPTSYVARQSCGCPALQLHADDGTGAADPERLLAADIRRLATGGREALPADVPLLDGAVRDVVAGAARLVAGETSTGAAPTSGDDALDGGDVAEALAVLYRLNPRREAVAAFLEAVQRYARHRSGDDPAARARADAAVGALVTAFAEVRVTDTVHESDRLRNALRNDYEISIDLLRDEVDPRSLQWLARTSVVAGCVGMWHDDAGAGERLLETRSIVTAGTARPLEEQRQLPPAAFPPRAVLDEGDATAGLLTFVLPAKTANRDWGLLAVVGPPETSTPTGRETYFQWAALLSVALDQEAMLASLRDQREDLARSYHRERDLVETIRQSEERYALAARAANDGLWDWDLTTGTVYYSERWKALLGFRDDEVGTEPAEWLGRVHPHDAPRLRAALDGVREGTLGALDDEHRLLAADGSYRWVLCRALAVSGPDGPGVRLVGSMTDVTHRRQLEEQLRHQALFDGLTGLPNRALFFDRLERAVALAQRSSDAGFAVLFLDLDGFKVVNDSLGHLTGDLLLTRVGGRIADQLRASDTAARLGGDEFAILLPGTADLDETLALVRRLQEALSAPYELQGQEVVVTAAIGIATSATPYNTAEDVLRDADIAMYHAKSRARGSHAVFDAAMRADALTRMRTEVELRHALDAGQMCVHYQPIADLRTGRVVGLEALLRWRHPQRGLLQPDAFLGVAEETGLVVPLGRWVLQQACADVVRWKAEGVADPALRVSVNVSNRQFWHGRLADEVDAALAATGASPDWLTLEITESVVMGSADGAQQVLTDLHARGVHLHVDDFGTGYSSLEALHRFPIQALKVDRSFVSRIESDARGLELVRTIVLMGRTLAVDVVAEGVETARQVELLEEAGCTLGQGHWFAVPVAADDVPALLGPLDALPEDLAPA